MYFSGERLGKQRESPLVRNRASSMHPPRFVCSGRCFAGRFRRKDTGFSNVSCERALLERGTEPRKTNRNSS
jgi:hypothetical protein